MNFLQSPPTHLPELGSDMLYKNPFVLQVVNAYLGPRPQFIYTAGNNASSGGKERQRVHKGEYHYAATKQGLADSCQTAHFSIQKWVRKPASIDGSDVPRHPTW